MAAPYSPDDERSPAALDRTDPLAPFRHRFALDDDLCYLDGNSLGPLPTATPERVREVLTEEWGGELIRAWTSKSWIDLPRRIGAKIARLVGAGPDEVLVCDSTSVNLYKLIRAALELRPERRVILAPADDFPTDLYVLQGIVERLAQPVTIRWSDDLEGDLQGVDADAIALVLASHVHYRTGTVRDLARLSALARRAGALSLWDLSHSAGVLRIGLKEAGADLAVGCGYKFLNGGPGAPAYLYVRRELQESLASPIQGWLGHAEPFSFEAGYRPAPGIDRFLCGTPPILSLAALEVGVDLALEAPLAAVEAKVRRLGEVFLGELRRLMAPPPSLACPAEPDARGSQISLHHPAAHAIVQALIARQVIGDFRAPDVMRFGFHPLHTRYRDVARAAREIASVIRDDAWDQPAFHRRLRVT